MRKRFITFPEVADSSRGVHQPERRAVAGRAGSTSRSSKATGACSRWCSAASPTTPRGKWSARTVHARPVYDSNRFSRLSQLNATESGTSSLYGLFQQMVYRTGGASSGPRLTVWGEAAFAPQARVNPMPLSWAVA